MAKWDGMLPLAFPEHEPLPSVTAPPRSAIPEAYTWNATSVFATPAAWEAEVESILADLAGLSAYQGHLNESPEQLRAALDYREELKRRAEVVEVYAGIGYAVETTNPAAAARRSRAEALQARVQAAGAFIEPEILQGDRKTLERWLAEDGELAVYRHYLEDLWRRQAHTRSAEVEELLGLLAEPFAGAAATAQQLTNADFHGRPATTADGREVPLTPSTYGLLLTHPDRTLRRTAWESYQDAYLAHRHTLANTLATSIRQDAFLARARRHASSLEAALFEANIPPVVFHQLLAVYQRQLPIWHRYWDLRRRMLGLDSLWPYDVMAPLGGQTPTVSFEQAVTWIAEALAPLGEDYVAVLRRGCLEERWVDRYPNQGKRPGAFSWGAPGTHPFIVMSYGDTVFSLSTLAHELGHSLHSYYSWREQPLIYSGHTTFAAEIASNFHQAMVRSHLLATQTDPLWQMAVIEEGMANFHRYLLIMPTLARFELEMHERVERGQPLTADLMIDRMADLLAEAYGPALTIERERVGITWATFNHLYRAYYVYTYATGIAAAHACARRIREGVPGAVAGYRRFLAAGNGVYPLDALAWVGVDMRNPEPVEEAFAVLAGLIDRLEQLYRREPKDPEKAHADGGIA
jgi:oligoendopeptidase F